MIEVNNVIFAYGRLTKGWLGHGFEPVFIFQWWRPLSAQKGLACQL